MLVDGAVVVELKAVAKLHGHRVGLLINFHTLRLNDGIKRMVNQL